MTDAPSFMERLATARAGDVIETLAAMTAKERRALAKPVSALFDAVERSQPWVAKPGPKPDLADIDALNVAIMGTATLGELRKLTWRACPRPEILVAAMRAFRPDWLDQWVAAMLEDNPYNLQRVECLWLDGICAKPSGEAYTLGLYVAPRTGVWPLRLAETDKAAARRQVSKGLACRLRARPDILETDLWHFFEVEGSGEFSLAAYDKYAKGGQAWDEALVALAGDGLISRARLLDATLDALGRDFAQFRAGWYSRLHTALAPTEDELAARQDRYLALLGSSIPTTVSFALKAVKALEKQRLIAPRRLLEALPPVLAAPAKSTVLAGLTLVQRTVKQAPDTASDAADLAVTALLAEQSDVQGKALDLVEALEQAHGVDVRATLAEYRESVAPSLRGRLEALIGAAVPPAEPQPPARSGRVAHVPAAIAPLAAREDVLAAFLHVLETPDDPLEVERVMDGLCRLGGGFAPNEAVLTPLLKRARQVLAGPRDIALKHWLSAIAIAWVESRPLGPGGDDDPVLDAAEGSLVPTAIARAFLRRGAESLDLIRRGHGLPLLSAPSDSRGQVAPAALVERFATYRAAGATPGRTDLSIALLRLAREGRDDALAALGPVSGGDAAVIAYALGGDVTPEGAPALWVAAAAGRAPGQDDAAVRALVGGDWPDAGRAASYEFAIRRGGESPYFWHEFNVTVAPPPWPDLPDVYLPGLFHNHGRRFEAPMGQSAPDLAWASLLWPGHLEPVLACALVGFEPYDTARNHPMAAGLDALLRSGAAPGPMGCHFLAAVIASEDKGLAALAADTLSQLIAEGRLPQAVFSAAVGVFVEAGAMPLGRWTRGLAHVAQASVDHADAVRAIATALTGPAIRSASRDLSGLLDLLYELHVARGVPLDDAKARDLLAAMQSRSKAGKLAGRLLALPEVSRAA